MCSYLYCEISITNFSSYLLRNFDCQLFIFRYCETPIVNFFLFVVKSRLSIVFIYCEITNFSSYLLWIISIINFYLFIVKSRFSVVFKFYCDISVVNCFYFQWKLDSKNSEFCPKTLTKVLKTLTLNLQ